jgi:hypothetical protein
MYIYTNETLYPFKITFRTKAFTDPSFLPKILIFARRSLQIHTKLYVLIDFGFFQRQLLTSFLFFSDAGRIRYQLLT